MIHVLNEIDEEMDLGQDGEGITKGLPFFFKDCFLIRTTGFLCRWQVS